MKRTCDGLNRPIAPLYPVLTGPQTQLLDELENPHASYAPSDEQTVLLRALARASPSSSAADLVLLSQKIVDDEDDECSRSELLNVCHNNNWPLNFVHLATLFGTRSFPEKFYAPEFNLLAHVLRNCTQIDDIHFDGVSWESSDRAAVDFANALAGSSHLRHFDADFEINGEGAATAMVKGLMSHHHLEHLGLSSQDDPEYFAPVLIQGLVGWRGSLQTLRLNLYDGWSANAFADVGTALRGMQKLSAFTLKFFADYDLSPLLNTWVDADHPAQQLRSLELNSLYLQDFKENAAKVAGAVVAAIAHLPNLETLIIDGSAGDMIANDTDLLETITRQGVINDLQMASHRGDIPLPPAIVRQLERNREQVSARSPCMFQAASGIFASTIAITAFSRCLDLGKVVTEYALGAQTPADLRAAQGMLFVSRDVWNAALNARFNALKNLLNNNLRSRTPASLANQA